MRAAEGNDRIFCGDKGEMIDLVKAGETAENLDIWGERANGMGGNDFIYGSQAKDLLLGGTGSDLVVGGSGDDALFGGGDALYGGAGNDFISNGFSLTGTSYN